MNQKKLSVIAISVGMFYIVITSIFRLLITFQIPFLTVIFNENPYKEFVPYIARSAPWFIFAIIVILLCYRFLKRLNKDDSTYLNNKASIRAITGVVVALQGGIDFFTSLASNINNFTTQYMNIEPGVNYVVMIYIVIILMPLVQIFTGVYLVRSSKYYKKANC